MSLTTWTETFMCKGGFAFNSYEISSFLSFLLPFMGVSLLAASHFGLILHQNLHCSSPPLDQTQGLCSRVWCCSLFFLFFFLCISQTAFFARVCVFFHICTDSNGVEKGSTVAQHSVLCHQSCCFSVLKTLAGKFTPKWDGVEKPAEILYINLTRGGDNFLHFLPRCASSLRCPL